MKACNLVNTEPSEQWLIGFYSGIGDLVCAHPWICRAAILNPEVKIDIAVSGAAAQIASILKWPSNIDFLEFSFPRFGSLISSLFFVFSIFSKTYDRVLNSPHPQKNRVSWKIPLLLAGLKFFRRAKVTEGAIDDPFSKVYTFRYSVNRNKVLALRDGDFFRQSRILTNEMINIDPFLMKRVISDTNEIGIHVGSSLSNKLWPTRNVNDFIQLFHQRNPDYKIIIFGLSHELEPYKNLHNVGYIQLYRCSLKAVIDRFLGLKAVVTVDSGFMHIAAEAKMPQVALFGASSVEPHRPLNKNALVLFKKKYPCQPCDLPTCTLSHNYCMESIPPLEVVESLELVLRNH